MSLEYFKNLPKKPNEFSLLTLRIIIGLMWLSEGGIIFIDRKSNAVDDYHGFLGQLQYMAKTNQLSLISSIINSYFVPNYVFLAWIIIFLEIGLGLSVILGILSRIGSLVGIVYSIILYIATLGWTGEWPWSYFMITMAMLVIFISSFETRIGLDFYLFDKYKNRKLVSILI